MADGRLSLEDIANYQVIPQTSATPTPTPLMTPLVSAAEPSQSSPFGGSIPSPARLRAQQLGLLDATTTGISQGLGDVAETYSSIPTIIENAPSLLGSAYDYSVENPGSALLTGLRGLAKTGAMGVGAFGGGVLGTAAGTAAGSFVPGAGNVVGGLTGGLLGAGTGAEGGAIAYEKIENATVKAANEVRSLIGLPAYELPYPEQYGTEIYQRLVRGATGGALTDLLNRATFGAARVGTGYLPKKATGAYRKYTEEMIPLSKGGEPTLDQKSAIGDLFEQAGVTRAQLEDAIVRKELADNPLDANKTTAQLLENPDLLVAEEYAKGSPFGQKPFLEMSEAQLAEMDNQVKLLMESPDPNNRELGLKLKEKFVNDKKAAWEGVEDIYNELYKTSQKETFSTTQLADALTESSKIFLPKGYAASKNILDKIIANLSPKNELIDKGTKVVKQVENRYDIRDLVGASSRLKEEARELRAAGKDSRLVGAYEKSARIIDSFIENDTRFGNHFKLANEKRIEFAQKFQSGQIQNLDASFGISPENIASVLSGTTDEWVQGMRVFGDSPAAVKGVLTQKLDEFNKLKTADAKLKWLDKNIDLFESTNKIDEIKQAQQNLRIIKNELDKDAAVGRRLDAVNLDGIGIGDIQKAAILGQTAALGEQDKAMVQGIRQVVRDKQRQATAGSMRSLVGLTSPTRSIGAAVLGWGLSQFLGSKVEKSVEQLNSMMVKALTDPKYALEMFNERGRLAINRAKRARTAEEAAVALKDAKIALGGGDQATRELVSGASGAGAAMLGALSNITPTPAAESEASPFNRMATATPAPAPTPAAGKVTSKMSLADIANYKTIPTPTPAATATPSELKAKAPKAISQKIDATATKYGLDSALMHAIVDQESEFNPKATSKMKAKGLMQLMPAVAASLDVDDVYNEDQNLEGGAKLLRQLMKRFDNDIELVLAAYNSTPSRISRQMAILRSKKIAPTWSNMVKYSKGKKPLVEIPPQTLAYVPKVLSKRDLYRS